MILFLSHMWHATSCTHDWSSCTAVHLSTAVHDCTSRRDVSMLTCNQDDALHWDVDAGVRGWRACLLRRQGQDHIRAAHLLRAPWHAHELANMIDTLSSEVRVRVCRLPMHTATEAGRQTGRRGCAQHCVQVGDQVAWQRLVCTTAHMLCIAHHFAAQGHCNRATRASGYTGIVKTYA